MSATPQVMPGIFGGTYKNTATYGTPTWAEQTAVKSVKPTYPWEWADAMSRQYPIKLYAKTFADLGLQVVMRADPADSVYAGWVAAHWSRITTLDLLILNSKITTEGCCGVRGEFLVSITDDAQDESGTIYTTFDVKPTLTVNGVPKWVLMGAASTPTFTAITFTT